MSLLSKRFTSEISASFKGVMGLDRCPKNPKRTKKPLSIMAYVGIQVWANASNVVR